MAKAHTANIHRQLYRLQRGVWNHVAVTTEKLSGGGLTVKFFVDGMAAGKFSSFDYTVSGTGSHNGTITFGRIPDKSSACEEVMCAVYWPHGQRALVVHDTRKVTLWLITRTCALDSCILIG